jgi:hypothetical protein
MTEPFIPSDQTIVAASLCWNVRPPDALASSVRELLSCIYKELLDPEVAQSVTMAAHELIENVVKYGAGGTGSFEVEICDRGGPAVVRLRTRNSALPEHLDGLRRLMERIGEATDPLALYDELIAGSPRRKGSGLGLARIRAEAEMTVVFSAEGRQVTMVAERRVSIRNAA